MESAINILFQLGICFRYNTMTNRHLRICTLPKHLNLCVIIEPMYFHASIQNNIQNQENMSLILFWQQTCLNILVSFFPLLYSFSSGGLLLICIFNNPLNRLFFCVYSDYVGKLKLHQVDAMEEKEFQPAERHLFMQVLMKCADISHPVRPPLLHRQWSNMISEEFFMQVFS